MENKKEFGKHYLVEFFECDGEKLKYTNTVENILTVAAEKSRATILTSSFHQFKPVGVSGFILITESHFSIHTWPDDRFAAVDIFTCGHMEVQAAIDEMKRAFSAQNAKVQVVNRGF